MLAYSFDVAFFREPSTTYTQSILFDFRSRHSTYFPCSPGIDSVESNDPLGAKAGMNPYIGMEFQYENEAYNFYNLYAQKMGFSIRKRI